MKQFEYQITEQTDKSQEFISAHLKATGKEGWELCGVIDIGNYSRRLNFYWKRQISVDNSPIPDQK